MEKERDKEKAKEKEKEKEARKEARAAKKQAKLARLYSGDGSANGYFPQQHQQLPLQQHHVQRSMLPNASYHGGLSVPDASYALLSLPTKGSNNESNLREAKDTPAPKVKSDDVSLFMSSIMQMQSS